MSNCDANPSEENVCRNKEMREKKIKKIKKRERIQISLKYFFRETDFKEDTKINVVIPFHWMT